jgi:hypothetical protein
VFRKATLLVFLAYNHSSSSAMDSTQRTYLATQIYSEQATISYRTVARALKVHVNAAKRILYEFHAHENGKKPNSVHATYLVAGTKKTHEYHAATNGNVKGADVDDDPIPSSPPPFTSSMLQSSQQEGDDQQSQNEIVPVKTITLVQEESLEGEWYSCSPSAIAEHSVQLLKVNTNQFLRFISTACRPIDYKTYKLSQTSDETCSTQFSSKKTLSSTIRPTGSYRTLMSDDGQGKDPPYQKPRPKNSSLLKMRHGKIQRLLPHLKHQTCPQL